MEIVKLMSKQKQVTDLVTVYDLNKKYNDNELSSAYFKFRVQFYLLGCCC